MSPWKKSGAGSGYRPAAVRDLARLDRIVQARIDAARVRFEFEQVGSDSIMR